MKLSACIEILFTEAGEDFADRARAAAAAGLPAVEFWMWRDKDLDAIYRATQECGTVIAGFCVEPWGQLTDPATHPMFQQGVRETVAQAKKVGVTKLITQVGQARPGVDRAAQHAAIVAGLTSVVPFLEDSGVTVMIEPLNDKVDHPGYYLTDTAEGVEVVREVGSPNVALIYDRYHSLMMGEPIGYGVEGNMDIVQHVHIADTNGRHQPGAGTANWVKEMEWFRQQGYDHYFGLEYWPTVDTAESLEYFANL